MLSRTAHTRVRTALALMGWAFFALCVAWVTLGWLRGWQHTVASVEDLHVRILFTFVGIAVTAAVARLLVMATRSFPKSASTGLAALTLSGVCYLLLVWTEWKV